MQIVGVLQAEVFFTIFNWYLQLYLYKCKEQYLYKCKDLGFIDLQPLLRLKFMFGMPTVRIRNILFYINFLSFYYLFSKFFSVLFWKIISRYTILQSTFPPF